MTETEAVHEFEKLLLCRFDDPEQASSIERGLATAALLALEGDDIERAKVIGKLALDAQAVPFRRV